MSDTTVSLPAHLRSKLELLPDILPEYLHARLSPYLLESSTEISHSVLLDISKWARTDAARSQLRAQALGLNDYTMISLLAGTITSPSSKFSPYVRAPDPVDEAKRTINDRKAITAILNALLSIGGAGYAGWWASGRTGWRDEWRVLFALMVASVVAISEGILYLIWQSRRDKSSHRRAKLSAHKKRTKEYRNDEDNVVGNVEGEVSSGLRRRQARLLDE